jgi:peptidoglycan-associated lipoprotein
MLDDPNSPISRRTIYFALDSSDISQADMVIIEAHARFLANHPDQRIVVRATPTSVDRHLTTWRSVSVGRWPWTRALVLSGASESQIRAVSYGEEQPANLGSGESAWSQNRRAELAYRDPF